jgi:type VI secretion system secreted protein Hcp
MALNAYMTITGQKQGAIHGSVIKTGHESTILVHSYDHEILSPRDPQSGLPTGKRESQPVTIVKEVDASSPQLITAVTNNETLTAVEIQFSQTAAGAATETLLYKVSLTNASIVSIQQSMGSNIDDPTENVLQEEVSLTYQKITWTWNDGGKTATDDWEAQVT